MLFENQHYVPESLLKRFKGDEGRLWELDKTANIVQHRSTAKAGAETNIYPAKVERFHMQQWDNPANAILAKCVFGKQDICLTSSEKRILEEWLLIFILRVPSHRYECNTNLDNRAYDRREQRRDILSHRSTYIHNFKKDNEETYAQLVKQMGRPDTGTFLIALLLERLASGAVEASVTGEKVFHHMLTSGHHRQHLKLIQDMKWRWIYSEHEFVIGDNPLARTKNAETRMHRNYGLANRDMVITFPFSKSLCLRMDRLNDGANVIQAGEAMTQTINRIQIASSWRKVWGPSVTALRPDSNETGFN